MTFCSALGGRVRKRGVLLLFLGSLIALGVFTRRHALPQGDTDVLLVGVQNSLRCIENYIWHGCQGVFHFPLLQYLPAALLKLKGFEPGQVVKALAYLNFFSFLALLGMGVAFFRRTRFPLGRDLFVYSAFCSPLLWYAQTSFNEMTAAMLTLAFMISALLRARGWVIALLFLAAGMTKEIAFPFLLLLGAAGLLPDLLRGPKKVRPQILGLLGGLFATLAINTAFNFFRFDSPFNVTNLNSKLLHVPNLKIQASFFFGLLVSPNGGLYFSWPTAAFLFTVLWALKWKAAKIAPDPMATHYLPVGLSIAVLFFLTLGLSKWFGPMGWISWGPRLTIPWIPALVLLALHFARDEAQTIVAWAVKRSAVFWGLLILTVLTVIPNVGAFSGHPTMVTFFTPIPECPRVPHVDEPDFYYHCMNVGLWSNHHFILWMGIKYVWMGPAKYLAILFAMTGAGLLWQVQKTALEQKSRDAE